MNGRLCSTVGLLTLVVGAEAFVSSSVSTTTPSRCDVRTPNVRSFAPPALHVWKDAREPEHNIIQSNITLDNDLTLEFNLHSSIAAIPPEAWNACLPNKDRIGLGSAFLDYSWLHCLEESKCASPQTGWVPQHVSIKLNGETKGFIPVYIKEHSMGEFIFDSSWADSAYQNKIEYYPKLLVAVPFTPATGSRILWHASVYDQYNRAEISKLRQAVAMFLRQMAIGNNMSSVHINFLCDEEATDIVDSLEVTKATNEWNGVKRQVQAFLQKISTKDEYIRRSSIQYHWKNRNPMDDGKPYRSFEEYLSCFKSKRRINIRRERQKVIDEGIRIDVVRGREILKDHGLLLRMFEIYQSTIQKMYWGRQYLTLEFFEKLAESDFIDNLCFMCARYNNTGDILKARDVFAGTFNVVKDGVFYGRYWGCLGEEIKNLHFETCYWSAIEYCIAEGIKRMEPGAGGGEYKWARGFDPALIHSVHYICHPGLRRAISQFVEYETENNVEVAEYLKSRRASQVLTVNQVVGK